jgi:hypothetical protein
MDRRKGMIKRDKQVGGDRKDVELLGIRCCRRRGQGQAQIFLVG